MPQFRILQVTLDLSLASTGVYTTAKNFYNVLTGQGHTSSAFHSIGATTNPRREASTCIPCLPRDCRA
jgi:hypothetical protein